jgi:hypothetical protein
MSPVLLLIVFPNRPLAHSKQMKGEFNRSEMPKDAQAV